VVVDDELPFVPLDHRINSDWDAADPFDANSIVR
jgi:hypothetical protein